MAVPSSPLGLCADRWSGRSPVPTSSTGRKQSSPGGAFGQLSRRAPGKLSAWSEVCCSRVTAPFAPLFHYLLHSARETCPIPCFIRCLKMSKQVEGLPGLDGQGLPRQINSVISAPCTYECVCCVAVCICICVDMLMHTHVCINYEITEMYKTFVFRDHLWAHGMFHFSAFLFSFLRMFYKSRKK